MTSIVSASPKCISYSALGNHTEPTDLAQSGIKQCFPDLCAISQIGVADQAERRLATRAGQTVLMTGQRPGRAAEYYGTTRH